MRSVSTIFRRALAVALLCAMSGASGATSPPPVAQRNADGNYEVDLLAVYTPLYESRYGGRDGTRSEVLRLVSVANQYFENSGVAVRYRLLAAEKYTGTQESSDGPRNLRILTADPAIRAYRDRVGADLVAFLRTQDGVASVELSSGFNGEDHNDPPQDVDPDRDFTAVIFSGPDGAGRRDGDWVFAHELGHNLGGGHNYKAHNQDGFYWKPYAHGTECGLLAPGQKLVSIMSYGDLHASGNLFGVAVGDVRFGTSTVTDTIEVRGDFFSSPNVQRNGMTCGSDNPGDPESKLADNARVINEAAPYVAAYRDAKVAPLDR